MDEPTIRTRAISYGRIHWKMVLHGASWLLAVLVTTSVALGHRQANSEQLAADVAILKTDVQGMKGEVASTNIALARIEGTLNGISMQAKEFDKFKGDVQKGAQEALATKVPKLSSSPSPRKRH